MYLCCCLICVSWCTLNLPCISRFTLCTFFSLQPRSILDPKVLGLQSGGWVVFRSDPDLVHNSTNLSCYAVLYPPSCWGTCRRNITDMLILWHSAPIKGFMLSVLWHTTERKWIYKLLNAFTTSATVFWDQQWIHLLSHAMRESIANNHVYPSLPQIMQWLCSHLQHPLCVKGARAWGPGVCAARHVAYLQGHITDVAKRAVRRHWGLDVNAEVIREALSDSWGDASESLTGKEQDWWESGEEDVELDDVESKGTESECLRNTHLAMPILEIWSLFMLQ